MEDKIKLFNLIYFSIDKRNKKLFLSQSIDKNRLKKYIEKPIDSIIKYYFKEEEEGINKLNAIANIIENISIGEENDLIIGDFKKYNERESIQIIGRLCKKMIKVVQKNTDYYSLNLNRNIAKELYGKFLNQAPPCGLSNPSSLCYNNSVCQLIYRITELKNFLLRDSVFKQYRKNSYPEIFIKTLSLMGKVYNEYDKKYECNNDRIRIAISKLFNNKTCPYFTESKRLGKGNMSIQQDASEFLYYILESLSISCLRNEFEDNFDLCKNRRPLYRYPEKDPRSFFNITIADINTGNTIITNIFRLNLNEVPNIKDGTTIQEILKYQLYKIVQSREYIFIVLDYLNYDNIEMKKSFKNKNIHLEYIKINGFGYECIGGVYHVGVYKNSGHYISLMKYDDWYIFDDEDVVKLNEKQDTDSHKYYHNSTPKILLYRRRGDDYMFPVIKDVKKDLSLYLKKIINKKRL